MVPSSGSTTQKRSARVPPASSARIGISGVAIRRMEVAAASASRSTLVTQSPRPLDSATVTRPLARAAVITRPAASAAAVAR